MTHEEDLQGRATYHIGQKRENEENIIEAKPILHDRLQLFVHIHSVDTKTSALLFHGQMRALCRKLVHPNRDHDVKRVESKKTQKTPAIQ